MSQTDTTTLPDPQEQGSRRRGFEIVSRLARQGTVHGRRADLPDPDEWRKPVDRTYQPRHRRADQASFLLGLSVG